jgi:hypothetical protein
MSDDEIEYFDGEDDFGDDDDGMNEDPDIDAIIDEDDAPSKNVLSSVRLRCHYPSLCFFLVPSFIRPEDPPFFLSVVFCLHVHIFVFSSANWIFALKFPPS